LAAAAPILSAAAPLPSVALPAAAAPSANLTALPTAMAGAADLGPGAPGTQQSAPAPEAAPRLNSLFDGARSSYEGARHVRFARVEGAPAEAVRAAEDYLARLARPPRLGTVPESGAVTRLRPLFRLKTRNVAALDPADPTALILRPEGRLPRFGAHRYVDLTNGSRFSTTDARGGVHHFVAVRGLREGYSIRVDLKTGVPATEKYVSDELLFEVAYDARGNVKSRKFVGPLVLSTSDDILVKHGRFVFEDGRVYSPAPGTLVVSGTVIADFLNRPGTLSYRNGFAELATDPRTGIPRVKTDATTGDPAWHYLSPAGSDFKNGMVLSTGRGREVVALFRIYAPETMGGRIPAGYSLIRLRFPSYEDFLKYDSNDLLADVLHPEALSGLARPRPTETGVLLESAQLREPYAADPRVTKSGFGPGSKPARVSMRRNGDVYLEESLGSPAVKLGRVPKSERADFPLKAGERKWLFLGHQLRYYQDGATYRDYNAFAWLTDEGMQRVERVRGGLMAADVPLDSGDHSLIVDLARHNYPMGAEVMENGEYHFSYGASDKHTGAARLDVLALLRELGAGSLESAQGLAYTP
jgi:hypothetical protein